jgi:Integrase core domain
VVPRPPPKAAPGVDGVTWHDYGRISRRPSGPARQGASRELPGEAVAEDVHTKAGWAAAAAQDRRVGGQDSSAGGGGGVERDLRAGLPRFSYGFRPGRKPHDPLDALATGILRQRVNWVLDADFRDYFSSLDHRWLVRMLEMALTRRRPDRGLIHHSDQGSQYTTVLFTKRCTKAGIEVSMGSVGDCYDNAVCETFHASLKKEKISRQSWPTRAAARTAIFEYIEGRYNPRRRHSTLGYLSPIEFERERAAMPALDFAARASISPESVLVLPTDPAQAATDGGQGTNGNGWPLRPVVREQAR